MRISDSLNQSILNSNLDVPLTISLVEDIINMEKTTLEAGLLFNAPLDDRFNQEIKIANAQILLSLLRMHCFTGS